MIIFDYNRTLYNPDTDSLYPDTIEVLEHYKEKGIKMFLVSKGDKAREKKTEDIKHYFEKVTVSPKKNIFMFLDIVASQDKAEYHVVGDRIRQEITFGNQLGMKTYWLKQGKFATEGPEQSIEEPDHTINSLKDITKFI